MCREAGRADLDHLQQRSVALAEQFGGNERDRADRHENVAESADDQPGEQHFREDPARLLTLLGHIHRILEADHGVEREGGGDDDAADRGAPTGVELDDAPEVAVAHPQRPAADRDDDQQSGEFHTGEQHVELHTFADPAQVDRRHHRHEHQGDHRDGGAGADIQIEGLGEVGREGPRGGGCGGDPGAHHRERNHEGEELDAERLVRIQGGSRGVRVLRDQFEVAHAGDERDQERDQKRHPHRAADLVGHFAGERVDAGAENIADDEQQQQARAHHTVQFRTGTGRGTPSEIGHACTFPGS